MKLLSRTAALVASSATAIAFCMANPAQALDFSFRGTFDKDNDVQLFNFTVGSASEVTLKTLSYAGGTQADGTVVARGGFDPILALFDGTGALIDTNDDGDSSQVPADAVTGAYFDTFLQALLNPGNYTVAVSQYANFANGPNLANGFRFDAEPNFANGFIDFTGDQRTNAWAFDVLNVDQASTPPSASIPTPALLPGLIGMGIGVLRKRKAEAIADTEA